MAITKEQINFMEIFKDLGTVCMTENVCGKCKGKECLIGYAKEAAAKCRVNEITYVPEGYKNIPLVDLKGGYDKVDTLHAMAHLLNQCRSCKEDHFENCIINVVRSCYEVVALGEERPYEGDALTYLMKLQAEYPEAAAIIMEEYKRVKKEN